MSNIDNPAKIVIKESIFISLLNKLNIIPNTEIIPDIIPTAIKPFFNLFLGIIPNATTAALITPIANAIGRIPLSPFPFPILDTAAITSIKPAKIPDIANTAINPSFNTFLGSKPRIPTAADIMPIANAAPRIPRIEFP